MATSIAQHDRRQASLDLTDEELRALLAGVGELAEREIRAAREGPIFSEPPSTDRLARRLGGHGELPLDGEPLADLLGACEGVLATGRRTGPGFFGYVHSPPSPTRKRSRLRSGSTASS